MADVEITTSTGKVHVVREINPGQVRSGDLVSGICNDNEHSVEAFRLPEGVRLEDGEGWGIIKR